MLKLYKSIDYEFFLLGYEWNPSILQEFFHPTTLATLNRHASCNCDVRQEWPIRLLLQLKCLVWKTASWTGSVSINWPRTQLLERLLYTQSYTLDSHRDKYSEKLKSRDLLLNTLLSLVNNFSSDPLLLKVTATVVKLPPITGDLAIIVDEHNPAMYHFTNLPR